MSLEATLRARLGAFTLDVALRLSGEGITSLFGPSGAGKTTILRALAGLDRHAGCTVRFREETWQDGRTFVPPHARRVGFVFQESSLFEHLSVRGNVEYGARRAQRGGPGRIDARRAIELLEVGPLLERRPATLSGGERRRVAIARALAGGPRLLLLDEPLAGVDRARGRGILRHVEMLPREAGVPVIHVSHSPDEVARLSDRLVLLDGGNVVASGPTRELLTRLDLPLARAEDAESIVDARVAEHDDGYELTALDFAGGRITVPRLQVPVGEAVRVRIAARDVSLALSRPEGTSILNVFPAVVEALGPPEGAGVTIRVVAAGVPLLARVTRRSADGLRLAPGRAVFVQAKSVAVHA